MAKRVDWVKLETRYVSGTMSLRELAKNEGVSFSTLSGVSSREGWAAKRKQYRDGLAAKTLARAQARGVKKLDQLMQAVEKTADMAMDALKDPAQFRRYIGDGEERVYEKLDTRALKEYTVALRELGGMLREHYGIRPAGEEKDTSVRVEFVRTDGSEG